MTLSFFSPPIKPEDERERQRAVDESGVLRSPPDPALNAIVQQTARLFGAPIAAVSIVDHERQWFAARVGLDAPETSRAVSFCGHAILTPGQTLIVPDAMEDDRFAGNPLVNSDPNVRFYAGVPLIAPNGQPLGALCVIDSKPRHEADLPFDKLAELAKRAAEAIAALNAGETLPPD